MIDVKGLTKRYGSYTALRDISLKLPPGRVVGLIGPNGAGKTTLMKCLMGYLRYEGEVRVAGINPRRERLELLRRAAFIPDVSVLPGWLRVREIVDYFGNLHPGFQWDNFQRLFARSELPPGKRVSKLSKGMKAKLYLLLILSTHSRLLILDEPTLGLDIIFRKEFFDTILSEYTSPERLIVISTHEVKEVEGILSDVVFLKEGRVVLQAELDELQQRFVQLISPLDLPLPGDLPRPLMSAPGISKPKYGASREISHSCKPCSSHSSNLFLTVSCTWPP